MPIRDYLYSVFENFDKPTELEFQAFIDFAGIPTTFTERIVTPSTTLLEDLNNEVFEIAVRQVYIIQYGFATYFLFGLEGTYGLNGIPITESNIVKLTLNNATALLNDIEVQIEVGGTIIGYTFPAGTSIEEVLIKIFTKVTVGSLSYLADNISPLIEAGETISISRFLWNIEGTPENLILQDNQGTLNDSVSGTSYDKIISYLFATPTEVIWTLSGDNVKPIELKTNWVYPTYFGKSSTKPTTSLDFTNLGTKVLSTLQEPVTLPLGTNDDEYGWIAIPQNQANRNFTNWKVYNGDEYYIGPNEFIEIVGTTFRDTILFTLYSFRYKSAVSSLTLS